MSLVARGLGRIGTAATVLVTFGLGLWGALSRRKVVRLNSPLTTSVTLASLIGD